jgi:hypothetical protein
MTNQFPDATKMMQLSPAAQAVLDAAFPVYDEETLHCATGEQHAGMIAAAALRAAADQVVPEPSDLDKEMLSIAALRHRWLIRDQFLAIANELEPQL